MKNRLRDSEIWKKKWFRELKPNQKCFVFFLFDNCDNAGIWDVDFELAKYMINTTENIYELKNELPFRIIQYKIDKWFIPSFLTFQYQQGLFSQKPIIIGVRKELQKQGLWEYAINLYNEEPQAIEIEEELQDGIKKEPKENIKKEPNSNKEFENFWILYDKKVDKRACLVAFNRLTKKNKQRIFETVKDYVQSTPNPQHRKNPLTYLHNGSWDNEIITNRDGKRLSNFEDKDKLKNEMDEIGGIML